MKQDHLSVKRTSRQIEAARRAMTRYIKRGGKIWIRVFPHTPITRKASEVPMGSGKGGVREKSISQREGYEISIRGNAGVCHVPEA